MRSNSVGEMVIRQLIREYQMKFDPSVSNLKTFSFGGGDIIQKLTSAASSWLKMTMLAAGGVFLYKNKDALEGLGTAAATAATQAIVKAATGAVTASPGVSVVPESRRLRETVYNNRFGVKVESDDIEAVAKNLIALIKPETLNLHDQISVLDEENLTNQVNMFNSDVIQRMKEIVILCTSQSRSYPRSLTTDFSITGPALPADASDNDDEQKAAGNMLLDVASIQLYSMLIVCIVTYYGQLKAAIDKEYEADDENEINKKLTTITSAKLKELSGNLDRVIGPAKQILTKSG